MTHRKDLIRKGFRSHSMGFTRRELEEVAKGLKTIGRISKYRIVPVNMTHLGLDFKYELYVKG